MRFAELVRLLAADAATQLTVLGAVPETAGVRDYVKSNAVYKMAWLYHRSFAVYDDAGGNEGLANWLVRTQLPPSAIGGRDSAFWNAAERLWTAVDLIRRIELPFLYTAHGLRKAREWRLVRHLATETCECGQWSRTLTETSFERLWEGLGDGILEMAWPDG